MIDCNYCFIKTENIFLLLKYCLKWFLFFFPESDCNSYNLLIIHVFKNSSLMYVL